MTDLRFSSLTAHYPLMVPERVTLKFRHLLEFEGSQELTVNLSGEDACRLFDELRKHLPAPR